VTTGLIRGL